MHSITKIVFRILLGFCVLTLHLGVNGQELTERIRLNQIGFYPNGDKMAVVVDSSKSNRSFFVLSDGINADTVFKGFLTKPGVWEYSEETVRKADFSSLSLKGDFKLYIPGIGYSNSFKIASKVFGEAAKASLRAFYYQRASAALPAINAGKWARKGGHPDNQVLVHASAASGKRPAGTIISSSKGWYDAGDFNKYIVNSGITMYTLMSIYEDFPFYSDTLQLNLPESKNRTPDLIDEILWNLRWMLTMQDPNDGGVYHKLTNANFDGSIMPENATKPRYVVKKGTGATLDFAAVMAQASRVFGKLRKQYPGLSDTCLKASIHAYNWAKVNTNVPYIQSELSDPTITTGAYDDFNFSDELFWASLELFVTTGKLEYYERSNFETMIGGTFIVPNWQSVATLGLYTMAKNAVRFKGDTKYDDINFDAAGSRLIKMAKALKNHRAESPYGIPMGVEYANFAWGSNAICANQGFLLLQAFLLSGDKSYLETANADLDYILGRNATTYSFMTGFGDKSPLNPHHRLSEADGVEEPVPGLMVGGPNPGQEDKGMCAGKPYPSSLPASSYIDHKCSYASNEIAINWQAPFAYLTNGIEAIRSGNFTVYNK